MPVLPMRCRVSVPLGVARASENDSSRACRGICRHRSGLYSRRLGEVKTILMTCESAQHMTHVRAAHFLMQVAYALYVTMLPPNMRSFPSKRPSGSVHLASGFLAISRVHELMCQCWAPHFKLLVITWRNYSFRKSNPPN